MGLKDSGEHGAMLVHQFSGFQVFEFLTSQEPDISNYQIL